MGEHALKQGEVWTIGQRADLRYRVVVLSSEAHNDRPSAAPFCAPVVRQRGSADDLPPFAIALAETDPISGVVVLNRMRRLPASIGAERLGLLTGASMAKINASLRELFDL
ncbi:mRNA interferase MazF [Asanoa ishikariensis]|uniref:mRNA interferase MazF n=1 Tax=Asanoa ishikariensis TaxID=137265 RepID=A0A1H3T545_9ACTN|nr:type II toxin-antitoxin system PemK/MazF family toxin [Asanoa ishikariensis]SDZ45352.1 mRNA interferase MazF [Asanoa ishikariensis]